jgi:hypothetical protein
VLAFSISGEGICSGVIGPDSRTAVPTLSVEVVGDEGSDSSQFSFVSDFLFSDCTTDFSDTSDGMGIDAEDGRIGGLEDGAASPRSSPSWSGCFARLSPRGEAGLDGLS